MSGWVGVDLDGTLAYYGEHSTTQYIGSPIPEMVERVKALLANGVTVKIFTARVSAHGLDDMHGGKIDIITPIQDWCEKHIGKRLEVTNVKDFGMIELYDDRAVEVITNTGKLRREWNT